MRHECSWCKGPIHKIEIPTPEGDKRQVLELITVFKDASLTYQICASCLCRELYLAKPSKPRDPERVYSGPA